jgi:hypothetical protein
MLNSNRRGAHEQEAAGEDAGVMAIELLPLTLPEVRRLLFALVWPPPRVEQVVRWSAWRRRHQARAKQAHIKRRRLNAQVRL